MQNSPHPITVFTTGGTIDKLYFDAVSEYQIGDSIVARLPAVARVRYPHRVVEFLRKDSLDLNDTDRQIRAKHVGREPSKRIVITHGTDTMAFAVAQSAAAGVYIAVNGEVFRGSEAVKDRASARFIRTNAG